MVPVSSKSVIALCNCFCFTIFSLDRGHSLGYVVGTYEAVQEMISAHVVDALGFIPGKRNGWWQIVLRFVFVVDDDHNRIRVNGIPELVFESPVLTPVIVEIMERLLVVVG